MFCELCLSFVLNLVQYTVVGRWQLDSKTGQFAVSWPRQIGE